MIQVRVRDYETGSKTGTSCRTVLTPGEPLQSYEQRTRIDLTKTLQRTFTLTKLLFEELIQYPSGTPICLSRSRHRLRGN